MEADAKSVPFVLQQTRAAVKPEARQTAWVHPCQPSSQMAILQTQKENITKMKAGVIQPNWGSETGSSRPCFPLQPAVGALPQGSDDGSRRQYSL